MTIASLQLFYTSHNALCVMVQSLTAAVNCLFSPLVSEAHPLLRFSLNINAYKNLRRLLNRSHCSFILSMSVRKLSIADIYHFSAYAP